MKKEQSQNNSRAEIQNTFVRAILSFINKKLNGYKNKFLRIIEFLSGLNPWNSAFSIKNQRHLSVLHFLTNVVFCFPIRIMLILQFGAKITKILDYRAFYALDTVLLF